MLLKLTRTWDDIVHRISHLRGLMWKPWVKLDCDWRVPLYNQTEESNMEKSSVKIDDLNAPRLRADDLWKSWRSLATYGVDRGPGEGGAKAQYGGPAERIPGFGRVINEVDCNERGCSSIWPEDDPFCIDPITMDLMCDPVKCSDGRTYDRWTIVGHELSVSPLDRSGGFRIVCDDIDVRCRLFTCFPEQELKFRWLRNKYREEALQHARGDVIELEDAIKNLNNVLTWDPRDTECLKELALLKRFPKECGTPVGGAPRVGEFWTQVGALYVNDTTEAMLGLGRNGTIFFEGVYFRKLQAGQESKIILKVERVVVKRVLVLTDVSEQVQKEKDFLISSRHPNLVRCHGIEQTEYFIYIALERCDFSLDHLICAQTDRVALTDEVKKDLTRKGLKLHSEEDWKLWDENKVPSRGLFDVMRGIVGGLIYLHGKGIAHGDLKPRNILINRDGQEFQAKIADMGLSKHLDDDAKFLEQFTGDDSPGTEGWQAPEQLRTQTTSTAPKQLRRETPEEYYLPADIFSLGCVLYYCITGGEHPFGEELEQETNIISGKRDLSHISDGRMGLLHDKKVSQEAKDLIESLLDDDSAKRPLAHHILQHPFFGNAQEHEHCDCPLHNSSPKLRRGQRKGEN